MRTFEVIMKIEVNDGTEAVKVTTSLPGDGDASVIAIQLKKLSEGLVSRIGDTINRDYPNAELVERLEILKNLTIKDLA
jgi:hypothetical protein